MASAWVRTMEVVRASEGPESDRKDILNKLPVFEFQIYAQLLMCLSEYHQ